MENLSFDDLLNLKCQEIKTVSLLEKDIDNFLSFLNQWKKSQHLILQKNTWLLKKEYKLSNYHQCILLFNLLSGLAQKEEHHPEIIVNYNRVNVFIYTHDVGGVSLKDIIYAVKADRLIHNLF